MVDAGETIEVGVSVEDKEAPEIWKFGEKLMLLGFVSSIISNVYSKI